MVVAVGAILGGVVVLLGALLIVRGGKQRERDRQVVRRRLYAVTKPTDAA
jgi:hypothetical protein